MTNGFMNCKVRVLARKLVGLQNPLGVGLKEWPTRLRKLEVNPRIRIENIGESHSHFNNV